MDLTQAEGYTPFLSLAFITVVDPEFERERKGANPLGGGSFSQSNIF